MVLGRVRSRRRRRIFGNPEVPRCLPGGLHGSDLARVAVFRGRARRASPGRGGPGYQYSRSKNGERSGNRSFQHCHLHSVRDNPNGTDLGVSCSTTCSPSRCPCKSRWSRFVRSARNNQQMHEKSAKRSIGQKIAIAGYLLATAQDLAVSASTGRRQHARGTERQSRCGRQNARDQEQGRLVSCQSRLV